MLHVLPLAQARQLLQNLTNKIAIPSETVPLSGCLGRVLANSVTANEDLPPFDRSAVDGFAVVSRDTFGASAAQPSLLHHAGEIRMGERAGVAIQSGECASVWTGGELPQGADAMVMLEEAERIPGGFVAVESASSPGRHVVFRGDDVRAGEAVLPAGRRIGAREMGLLAALGITQVEVRARPRVSILSTGDELVGAGATPREGQLRDVNGPMLHAACIQAGADARFLGIVPDCEEELLSAMQEASESCDLLLLSGASSAGAKDTAARGLARLGEVAFHGLALKPGKPTFGGSIGNTLVVGLPGHPAAAYLVFHALVRPALATLCGDALQERTRSAILTQALPSNHGREELVPVCLIGDEAEPVALKSGLISPLCRADGYLQIPRDAEGLPKGARVEVILF